MRKYEPIWLQLKEHRQASVIVAPAMQARVIKAVIKEKDMDVAYKYLTAERHEAYKLCYTKKDNLVQFTLKREYFTTLNHL